MKRFGVALGLMIFGAMYNCYSMQKLPKKALLAYQKTKKDFSKESIKKWNKTVVMGLKITPFCLLYQSGKMEDDDAILFFAPGGFLVIAADILTLRLWLKAGVLTYPIGMWTVLGAAAFKLGDCQKRKNQKVRE